MNIYFQVLVSDEQHTVSVSCFPELEYVVEVRTGWDKIFAEVIKRFSDGDLCPELVVVQMPERDESVCWVAGYVNDFGP